ncbi:hypothetical protein QJQ45_001842 [Haematococcus lacustris]|nr:hypothetical protein QJQ45_001842 [Haematococcus lacustris]
MNCAGDAGCRAAGVSAVLVEGAKFCYVYGVVGVRQEFGEQQVLDMQLSEGERVMGARLLSEYLPSSPVESDRQQQPSCSAAGQQGKARALLLVLTQHRLLVQMLSKREARDHGLQCVGLPSRLATFTCLPPTPASLEPGLASAAMAQPAHSLCWWRSGPATPAISSHPTTAACCTSAGGRGHGSLPTPLQGGKVDGAAGAAGSTLALQPAVLQVSNVDQRGRRARPFPVCTLLLPPGLGEGSFPGPRMRLSLPSYSGATPDCPALLKYACHLHTNISVMAPARVSLPLPEAPDLAVGRRPGGRAGGEVSEEDGELMTAVLGGRPLLALNFHDMEVRRG